MDKAIVYFAKASITKSGSLNKKLGIVIRNSGMLENIKEKDSVALKLHFGELGNTRYIRPIWLRELAELIKSAKGMPFLTDTTTLYKHARHTWFDYLETCKRNGFTSETVDCPIIIADGLKSNGVYVNIDNPLKVGRIKVAQAIYDADAMICLTHLTLHGSAGLGGCIKNIAMGCTTKESKMAMHTSESKPKFIESNCILCGMCVKVCPVNVFRIEDGVLKFDMDKCIGCAECIAHCKGGALKVPWGMSKTTQDGIIDGARAVVSTFQRKKIFYLTLAVDITADCDCASNTDLPIVPDIGLLASYDPVAIDKASWDMLKESPGYYGSRAEGKKKGEDIIKKLYPSCDMDYFFTELKKAGLGSLDYELLKVE